LTPHQAYRRAMARYVADVVLFGEDRADFSIVSKAILRVMTEGKRPMTRIELPGDIVDGG